MRRTNAVRTAVARAAFTGHVCDDPLAKWFLPGPLRWAAFALNAVPGLLRLANRVADWISPGRFSHVACRTAFIDGVVDRALARGIRQVVILGAGFDSRSWRFRDSRAQFFEVDHPEAQLAKRRVTKDALIQSVLAGPVFVPADPSRDNLASALTAAGFDSRAPALFIWERADELPHAMAQLWQLAAPGSELVGEVGGDPEYVERLICRDGWTAEEIAGCDELRRRFLGGTRFSATTRTPARPRTVGRWSVVPACQMQQTAA